MSDVEKRAKILFSDYAQVSIDRYDEVGKVSRLVCEALNHTTVNEVRALALLSGISALLHGIKGAFKLDDDGYAVVKRTYHMMLEDAAQDDPTRQ